MRTIQGVTLRTRLSPAVLASASARWSCRGARRPSRIGPAVCCGSLPIGRSRLYRHPHVSAIGPCGAPWAEFANALETDPSVNRPPRPSSGSFRPPNPPGTQAECAPAGHKPRSRFGNAELLASARCSCKNQTSTSGTKTCRERRKVVVMVGWRHGAQTWQRRSLPPRLTRDQTPVTEIREAGRPVRRTSRFRARRRASTLPCIARYPTRPGAVRRPTPAKACSARVGRTSRPSSAKDDRRWR